MIAAAIGFPFAMLFSWFYEWTPHGIPIQRTTQSATWKNGNTWVATCTSSHALAA